MFGCIDRGHGLKGKQNMITNDQDLVEMYAAYKNKHDILLWCYFESDDVSKQRKRPVTSTALKRNAPPSKRTCESTIIAV